MQSIPRKTCAQCCRKLRSDRYSDLCKECASVCACGKRKDFRADECSYCANRRKALVQWKRPEVREKMLARLRSRGPRERRLWDDLTEEDFRPRKEDGRYVSSYNKDGENISVYRNVWRWTKANGAIPAGMHIHHKSEDKTDDALDNLEMLTASQHMALHMSSEEEKRRRVELRGQTVRETIRYICEHCRLEFFRKRNKKPNRFCCRACKDVGMRKV